MKYRLLAISLLTVWIVSAAAGQQLTSGRPHTDSSLSLSGNIMTLDGRPVVDARVEVHDIMTGALVASAFSMPNGSFTFPNVPVGHYEVRALRGMQEAHERVELDQMDQQVTLHVATAFAQAGSGSGATVSVAEMRVPDKSKKELEKSQQAFEKHNLDEARVHCAKALAEAPNYSRALTLSALLDLTDNKLEDAALKGEQAIKSDNGYGMGYVVLASVYNSMQRYDDAIRTLDHGMPLVPDSWQAHFEMSKALLGKGDYQRSLASVDRALQTAPPTFASLHLLRAHVLLGLKAYSEAVPELEKYIGDDPSGADATNARKTLAQVKAFVASARK